MTQTFLALITCLFPLAYSPGPGNVFVSANGSYFCFKATIAATTYPLGSTMLADPRP